MPRLRAAAVKQAITFVGPRPEILELFGDKLAARALAERCGVPVMPGTSRATSLDEARKFFASLGGGAAMMIKAVAGGGGRGMRVVHRAEEIEEAFARCQSEARAAFGNGDVYVEQLMPRARHIEVQIIGDGSGAVSHLWERECTIQRRNQKLVEVAPSPGLPARIRARLLAAAVKLAEQARYDNLGTFEFLLDASREDAEPAFAFIEANPRLQVEHTVTEEVTGVDLVKVQLQLAAGRSLAELGLKQAQIPEPRGFAMQMRINMESMGADGVAKPSGGTLTAFEAPSGPGLRIDTFAYTGYTTNPRFDSLLAKLIAHSPGGLRRPVRRSLSRAVRVEDRWRRDQCRISAEPPAPSRVRGESNLHQLRRGPYCGARRCAELAASTPVLRSIRRASPGGDCNRARPARRRHRAGAQIDSRDPLAVLDHGKSHE